MFCEGGERNSARTTGELSTKRRREPQTPALSPTKMGDIAADSSGSARRRTGRRPTVGLPGYRPVTPGILRAIAATNDRGAETTGGGPGQGLGHRGANQREPAVVGPRCNRPHMAQLGPSLRRAGRAGGEQRPVADRRLWKHRAGQGERYLEQCSQPEIQGRYADHADNVLLSKHAGVLGGRPAGPSSMTCVSAMHIYNLETGRTVYKGAMLFAWFVPGTCPRGSSYAD